jgi:hypothetical protein
VGCGHHDREAVFVDQAQPGQRLHEGGAVELTRAGVCSVSEKTTFGMSFMSAASSSVADGQCAAICS